MICLCEPWRFVRFEGNPALRWILQIPLWGIIVVPEAFHAICVFGRISAFTLMKNQRPFFQQYYQGVM